MTIHEWVLIGLAGAVVGLFLYVCALHRALDELLCKTNNLDACLTASENALRNRLENFIRDISLEIKEKTESLDNQFDQHEERFETYCDSVYQIMTQKKSEMQGLKEELRAVKNRQNEFNKKLKEADAVARESMYTAHYVESLVSPDLDILDMHETPSESIEDTSPVYSWIFNKTGDLKDIPLTGDNAPLWGMTYLVAGTISSSDADIETCCEGYWDGRTFTDANGERFKNVYAYIQMPDPSDIMERLFDCSLSKGA